MSKKTKPGYCEGCGVKERGAIYREILSEYRGQMLCSWCRVQWSKREKQLERELTWNEFCKGIELGEILPSKT